MVRSRRSTRAAIGLALAGLVLVAPAAARAHKHCVETSDVVGERNCSRYGAGWAAERSVPIVLGLGAFHGQVSPIGRSFAGKIGKSSPTLYDYQGDETGLSTVKTYGFDLRTHGFLTRSLYLGFDWAMAFAHASPQAHVADGWALAPRNGLNFFQLRVGPSLGLRIPAGRLSLRGEIGFGLQILSMTQNARPLQSTATSAGAATYVGGYVEPRVAVDAWTSPWSTVSVWGGVNVLHPADRSFGLAFALHGRAFDGAFD